MSLADEIRAKYTLTQDVIDEIVECITNCGRISIGVGYQYTSATNLECLNAKYKPFLIKWATDNGFNVNVVPQRNWESIRISI